MAIRKLEYLAENVVKLPVESAETQRHTKRDYSLPEQPVFDGSGTLVAGLLFVGVPIMMMGYFRSLIFGSFKH